jgi:CubicO group peptidase (beta-lactamase class C family)
MKPIASLVALALLSSFSTPILCADADGSPALPRSTPETQGIASPALLAMIEEAERSIDALHSIMIVRHGHVVAEGWWAPYASNEPHMLYSLSKSFTSTAIGIAQAEGRLSIDDPVLKFFPGDAPVDPSENLKAMRIRSLLMMSSGHLGGTIGPFPFTSKENLTRAFLALPVEHKPGTHFVYNTPASFMLSAVVQKVTGETALDYLGPRLFEPLGIGKPEWESSAEGISFGGFGLSLKTEDIARFGQLLLQRGEWNGRRILSAEWVDAATSLQTSNGVYPDSDWDQGYGYQFWRCRHGFYRGDGAFGQFCFVMPQYDTVIAITSGTGNMGAVMNLLWDRLLPELRPMALPANDAAAAALARKLASLTLSPQGGAADSAMAKEVHGRTYAFAANPVGLETISIRPEGDGVVLVVRAGGSEYRMPCGIGAWKSGGTFPMQNGLQPVTGSGGWTADDTFSAKFCFHQTPFIASVTMRFEGERVHLVQKMNVGFGPQTPLELTGTAR